MRSGARTFPLDTLSFFSIANRQGAFALTVNRVKDILSGVVAKRITLNGGFVLAAHASNTVPVLASGITATWRGVITKPTLPFVYAQGQKIFVQPTDPALGVEPVNPGDVWIK